MSGLVTVLNGRPTEPQVERAMERVRSMKPDDILTHNDLAQLWGEPYKTTRYRTLLGSLKRRVRRELQVRLIAESGIGYRYPKGFEQVKSGVRGIRSHVKGIGRETAVVAMVSDERLPDPNHRAARNHVVARASYLAVLAKAERRTLELTVGRPEVLPSPATA